MIVGGGVVLSASYEARAFGVRTAMGGRAAHRLCPHAVVVSPRFTAYSEASKAAYRVFDEFSPAVEGLSIDEAFLDVRGLEHFAGTPREIAARLRRAVLADVGLPITVGVARTKFLAKVASGVAKPDGLLVVPPDRELGFLHALPVEKVWGVGRVTAEKLHNHGIRTVGELAAEPPELLVAMLGRAAGRQLHALAHNRDPRPVETRRRRRTMGAQRALGRPPHSQAEIDASLVALVDRVTRRMRTAGRAGRTVVLRLRFADYSRATRSHTLPCPTAQSAIVLATARGSGGGVPAADRRARPDTGRGRRHQSRQQRQRSAPAALREAQPGGAGRRHGRRPRPLRIGRRGSGGAARARPRLAAAPAPRLTRYPEPARRCRG